MHRENVRKTRLQGLRPNLLLPLICTQMGKGFRVWGFEDAELRRLAYTTTALALHSDRTYGRSGGRS